MIVCLRSIPGTAALVAVGLLVPAPFAKAQSAGFEKPVRTGLVRVDDAIPTRGDWGEWRRYARGHTHGVTNLVVLAVTLKPGQSPHLPHRHAEEEFLILADGSGTWHLEGKDYPARKGDVVYAAPWSMHGIECSADGPLTYYMVKWNGKGVEPPAEPKAPAAADRSKVNREELDGTRLSPKEKQLKLSGKVTVLDAHTLRFADGTVLDLNGAMVAPELEQQGLIGGKFYPLGKESAAFLTNLIGDRTVTCYGPERGKEGVLRGGLCVIGETCIRTEMMRHGWAVSHHSAMEGWELLAREGKRGMWRGEFVNPWDWRKGKRLPGEGPAPKGEGK